MGNRRTSFHCESGSKPRNGERLQSQSRMSSSTYHRIESLERLSIPGPDAKGVSYNVLGGINGTHPRYSSHCLSLPGCNALVCQSSADVGEGYARSQIDEGTRGTCEETID